MGISTFGVVLAPAVGPAFGGLIIDSLSWRYVFLLGAPISLVVLPLSLMLMPPRDPEAQRLPFDWIGVITASVAVTLLLIGLSNGEKEGWGSNYILFCLGATVVCCIAFIYWEKYTDYPLMSLRIFSIPRFSILALVSFTFGAGLYGSTFLVPLFLQIVQGLTPTDSGLLIMPAGLIMGVFFVVGGRMAEKVDVRWLVTVGFTLFAYSSYLMVTADQDTQYYTMVWWIIIGRVGIGLSAPSLILASYRCLPAELLQQGAGATNFIRQLGGAFGVNLLSLSLARRTSFHTDIMMATQDYGHSDSLQYLRELQHSLIPAGLTALEQQYVSIGLLGEAIYHQAVTQGFKDGFMVITLVFLATLVPTWYMRKD